MGLMTTVVMGGLACHLEVSKEEVLLAIEATERGASQELSISESVALFGECRRVFVEAAESRDGSLVETLRSFVESSPERDARWDWVIAVAVSGLWHCGERVEWFESAVVRWKENPRVAVSAMQFVAECPSPEHVALVQTASDEMWVEQHPLRLAAANLLERGKQTQLRAERVRSLGAVEQVGMLLRLALDRVNARDVVLKNVVWCDDPETRWARMELARRSQDDPHGLVDLLVGFPAGELYGDVDIITGALNAEMSRAAKEVVVSLWSDEARRYYETVK